MTRGDLEGVTLWGRPIKPVGLGVSVLMGTLMVANFYEVGIFGDTVLAMGIAVLSGIAFVLLVWGWVGRIQRFAEYGLLLAAFTYMARALFAFFTLGVTQSSFLSLGAVIISGGSYLLETWDTHRPWEAWDAKHTDRSVS